MGDIYTDGVVNITDIIMLKKYLAQGGASGVLDDMTGSEYNFDLADVNGDGRISQGDLTLIIRYVSEGWNGITLGE